MNVIVLYLFYHDKKKMSIEKIYFVFLHISITAGRLYFMQYLKSVVEVALDVPNDYVRYRNKP